MSSQAQEPEKTVQQSGDPGRTPGAAEGDRETVEADLQEKNLDQDSENYEKTKERKINESTSSGRQ
jgi:hypothetical protein